MPINKTRIIWMLIFVVVVYSALDTYQSHLLFSMGAYEANPLLDWLMRQTGTWMVIPAMKAIMIGLLCALIFISKKEKV